MDTYPYLSALPVCYTVAYIAAIVVCGLFVVFLLLFAYLFLVQWVEKTSHKRLQWLSFGVPVVEKLFSPLIWLASKRTDRKKQQSDELLEKTSETVLENENILKGIEKFGNIDAHAIMKSRIDVETVNRDVSFPELLRLSNESGYSRLPVMDERDNVTGVLYVKDVLPFVHEGAEFNWQSLIREAHFVPGNKKIDDLLKEFQAKKIHMAVIIDEYGSMAGIVTLEDILEEIVGDIADESDDDEPDYRQIAANTYLFDGKVLLNDFYRIMHVEDTIFDDIRGEADTLAGLILELKGEIPQKGDNETYEKFAFNVEEMDNRRIKQIKVTVNE